MVSKIFYFHLYLGKIPILTKIFQRGWNHQLEIFLILTRIPREMIQFDEQIFELGWNHHLDMYDPFNWLKKNGWVSQYLSVTMLFVGIV